MGSKQLSSLLVQDGVVTRQHVEEAFQRQVLFGGRLGTNLLELGVIDEATLLLYLSMTTGLPWADRDLVTQIDWEAVELLDLDTMRGEKLLPVRFDGQTVRALVTDPVAPERLRELKHRLGAGINQYITSEFRFDALLEKLFDVPLSNRFRLLDERFPIERTPIDRDAERAGFSPDEVVIDELDDDLVDELTVDALDADMSAFEPVRIATDAIEPLDPELVRIDSGAIEPLDALDAVDEVEPLVVDTTAEPEAAEPLAPHEPIEPVDVDLEPEAVAATPPPSGVSMLQPVVVGGHSAARAPVDATAAWETFVVASNEAETRDDALLHFAHFACSVGARCVLLVVSRDRLRGFLALGTGTLRLDMRTISVRLRQGSEVSLVTDGNGYYRGPIDGGELEALYAKMQLPLPAEVIALPVKLGPRVVLVAIVDQGPDPLPEDLGALFDAVYATSEALERIFLSHRTRSSQHAAPEASDPRLPPHAVARPPTADDIPEIDIELDSAPHDSRFDVAPSPGTLNELVELEAVDEHGNPSQPGIAAAELELAPVSHASQRDAGSVVRPTTLGAPGGPRQSLDDAGPLEAPRAGESSLGAKAGFASVPHDEVFARQAFDEPPPDALESEDLAIIDDVEPLRDAPEPEVVPPTRAEILEQVTLLDARDRAVARHAREVLSIPSVHAVGALMQHFPGRLRLDRFHYERDTPPPQRHSRVLEALVAQGELAEEAMLGMLYSSSADERFYALLTLAEIRSERVIERLSTLVFDKDPQVRATAVRMARARRSHPGFQEFVDALRAVVADGGGGDERRLELALQALGQTRTMECLPSVLPMLEHPNRRVADAARDAALALSLENPGSSLRKWERWWGSLDDVDRRADRIQRLADAMVHKDRQVRERAAEELSEFPGMMLNYHPDAHRRERQRARQAFLDWTQAHPERASISQIPGVGDKGRTLQMRPMRGSGGAQDRD